MLYNIAYGGGAMFFLFKNTYIAIIGDIQGSKMIENRKDTQIKLETVLEEINLQYSDNIASKFTITLGDEFQGLLLDGGNVLNILSKIERRMHPVKLRFGVGIGEITTDINPSMSIGADGPGYYRAREAIENLKEKEKRKQTYAGDILFKADDENQLIITMLNTIIELMFAIKSFWSDRQREVIWDMLEYHDNQINTAKRLKIKQPTVQKALVAGKYYAYKEAIDTIESVLSEIRRKSV